MTTILTLLLLLVILILGVGVAVLLVIAILLYPHILIDIRGDMAEIQSFVIDSGPLTVTSGTSETKVYSYTFTERRRVIGFMLRCGVSRTGHIEDAGALEAIAELTPQALGLQEGVLGTLSTELHSQYGQLGSPTTEKSWYANPGPVKEEYVWFPQGHFKTFEKGDSINLLLWYNNTTGYTGLVRAYVIIFYV